MNALLLLTATAALGIDYGYQPLPTGGVEYIIQIEPQLLDQVAQGKPIISDIPAGLDVRRFRITVGNGQLPRELPPATIRDGRPQLQQDEPVDSRPHMHLDERDSSRPVLRDDPGASPVSATSGFSGEAPPRMNVNQSPQTPFDRRPMGVTAESQQSRPILAPELEAAPPMAQQPQEPVFNTGSAGSRYSRDLPQNPPYRPMETAIRPSENTVRTIEPARPFGATQPTAPSSFGRPPVNAEQYPNPNDRPVMVQDTQKPQFNEEDEARARAALKSMQSSTPFWTALFGLFCSAGGNVYLGWMTWSARMKYHSLVQKFRSSPSPA